MTPARPDTLPGTEILRCWRRWWSAVGEGRGALQVKTLPLPCVRYPTLVAKRVRDLQAVLLFGSRRPSTVATIFGGWSFAAAPTTLAPVRHTLEHCLSLGLSTAFSLLFADFFAAFPLPLHRLFADFRSLFTLPFLTARS